MKTSNKLLWTIIAILFLSLAVVAVIKVQPLLNPEIVSVAFLDKQCDLRAGPCRSMLPDGSEISLSIGSGDIPLVKPLALTVEVDGIEAKAVEVDFIGLGMDMGFNRPKLELDEAGRFRGTGMLPVCIRDAMEWEAKVLVTTAKGIIAAPYRFIAVKPGVSLPKQK